jgi:hypothetical protein
MARATDRRLEYKVEVDWANLPKHTNSLEGIADEVVSLRFRREKSSHRGISRFRLLRQLVAFCVNQECLEEISELPQLETLYISQLSATDVRCLGRCRSLRHLVIKHGTKIPCLSWVPALPPLDSLLLENLKKVEDISSIESLPSLKAFGFEGSIWATQRVASFQPIAHLPRLDCQWFAQIDEYGSIRTAIKARTGG